MKIKLDDGAIMPTRAHSTDAGLDLYSLEDGIIYPRQTQFIGGGSSYYCYDEMGKTFDTGVHIQFSKGTYGKIESRSGLNIKNGVVCCGGVIDEGYTGSIKVKLYNLGVKPFEVSKGMKIAQLIIQPYLTPDIEVVDELDETDRGDNGFGSTGI